VQEALRSHLGAQRHIQSQVDLGEEPAGSPLELPSRARRGGRRA